MLVNLMENGCTLRGRHRFYRPWGGGGVGASPSDMGVACCELS